MSTHATIKINLKNGEKSCRKYISVCFNRKKVSVGIMISNTDWRVNTYPKRMVEIDDTKIPITSMNFAPI